MRTPPATVAGAFPKPKGVLRWVLLVPFSLWLIFALAINWMGPGLGSLGANLYQALVLDVGRLAQGEVWRLLTAPLLHLVSGPGAVSHILTTLLLLYFFGMTLQRDLGERRFLWVLGASALGGELLQVGAMWALPEALARGLSQPVLLGGHAAALACVVAWGATHRNATVYLFFALPVRGATVVLATVVFALLNLVAAGGSPEGMLAPFGGMLVGYLLGGGTPSPLRKAFLRWKLRRLSSGPGAAKGARGGLRVVPGGREGEAKRDGRWLN